MVLALGNSPNALPQSADKIRNAWSAEALEDLDPNDDVLLIGTGLTMVDMVLSLHQRKHKGKIYAVSLIRHYDKCEAFKFSLPKMQPFSKQIYPLLMVRF